MFYRTRCINTAVVINQLILHLCCHNAFVLRRDCLLCFRLLSARVLIGYGLVSRDNLQIIRVFVLGAPPHTSGFLIVNNRCSSEQIQSLLTHLTFRSTKIIRTLPRIVGRGEIVLWCVPSITGNSQSQKSQSQLYCQFCHMYRTYIQRIEIALLSYSLVHTDNTKH